MRSPCLCCESVEYKYIGEKNRYDIEICKDCKTLIANSKGADLFDYDEYYSEVNLELPDFILRRIEEIVSDFEPYRKTGRLLDVGCGAGSLIRSAEKAGWQAEGLEVSASSVEFLKKSNFKVFHGEIEDAEFPENSFDVVTATEILEHTPAPHKIINEAFRILRPGGLFWGTTPNGTGISGKILGSEWDCVKPPEHLQLFSVKGFGMMLEKAGFHQKNVITHGVNPYELIYGIKRKIRTKYLNIKSSDLGVDRVPTSYALNEALMSSPWRNNVKKLLNNTLDLLKLGDSLKFKAIK